MERVVMTRFVDTADGVRLAYEGAGAGEPALLFAHGWCCDRSYFAPQLRHFAARHAVLTLDLRGHGESGRPEPGTGVYDIETLAGDVLAVARDAGLDRPVVVGHSLGGLVALACATRPDAVRAAVMIDPAPMLPGPRKQYFEDSLDDVAQDHDGSWRREFLARLFQPTDTARRAETMIAASAVPPPVAAALMQGMARFEGGSALDRVRVPLLAITAGKGEPGVRDHPAVAAGRTVGAGHFNQLEVPDQVNAMIERFLVLNCGREPRPAGVGGRP
jgi:pimeloyl-ACP methyl ester carboxylesterase